MKNIRFCAAVLFLVAVIAAAGYGLLRAGDAKAMQIKMQATADRNADKIKDSTLPVYEKETVPPSGEHMEITADVLDSIIIDGIELAFPTRLGDLPDDFSYTVISNKESADEPGVYGSIIGLMYQEQLVATGTSTRDVPELDDDAVITTWKFGDSNNRYLPQVTVAGFDVLNADIREVSRVYGCDAEEYGYDTWVAEDTDGYYTMTLYDGRIGALRYLENEKYDAPEPSLTFYGDSDQNVRLPEGYTLENDTVNNALQAAAAPLPEKNDAFETLLSYAQPENGTIQLPCTLNALLSAFGDAARFQLTSYDEVWHPEQGVFEYEGVINVVDYPAFDVVILIRPGNSIGESQVISFTDSGYGYMYTLYEQLLRGEYAYGLYDGYDGTFRLTEYAYNNVVVSRHVHEIEGVEIVGSCEITFSYWPENTQKYELE